VAKPPDRLDETAHQRAIEARHRQLLDTSRFDTLRKALHRRRRTPNGDLSVTRAEAKLISEALNFAMRYGPLLVRMEQLAHRDKRAFAVFKDPEIKDYNTRARIAVNRLRGRPDHVPGRGHVYDAARVVSDYLALIGRGDRQIEDIRNLYDVQKGAFPLEPTDAVLKLRIRYGFQSDVACLRFLSRERAKLVKGGHERFPLPGTPTP
jgi:hypothetical protein